MKRILMEYFWYALSALAAGVGTGLAGLSAATVMVPILNKNIDLRRGWMMLVCILSMCVAGSIAAWHAGHVVLGTFSLFLCVGIGSASC